jgi:hypothetical protein
VLNDRAQRLTKVGLQKAEGGNGGPRQSADANALKLRIHKAVGVVLTFGSLFLSATAEVISHAGNSPVPGAMDMSDIPATQARLRQHLHVLTVDIGERSVRIPANLRRTADYIRDFYRGIGIEARLEPYGYHGLEVANVIAEVSFGRNPVRRILIGAHYDSVAGTVGADDNASAVAVQLETARRLTMLTEPTGIGLAVVFVSFALEEPPVYGTRFMGSRVYAEQARRRKEQIDGMLCLEMVGYTCAVPGRKSYPFPLMFFGYPKEGNFIGIVGSFGSRHLTRSLFHVFQKNSDLPVIQLTVPFNGWIMPAVRLSDHASFWDQGFPAVMITDSAFYRNPNYHRPSDRMDTLDTRFMSELVESLVMFLAQHR